MSWRFSRRRSRVSRVSWPGVAREPDSLYYKYHLAPRRLQGAVGRDTFRAAGTFNLTLKRRTLVEPPHYVQPLAAEGGSFAPRQRNCPQTAVFVLPSPTRPPSPSPYSGLRTPKTAARLNGLDAGLRDVGGDDVRAAAGPPRLAVTGGGRRPSRQG